MGTDTGGSIRGPSTSNGIVGLKPTHGLLSRDGIIPLALSFDTGGPMARSVYDVAVALGRHDRRRCRPTPRRRRATGKFETDYTKYLKADALKGARIGVARDFIGADPDVDWVIDAALDAMRKAGATIVDVRYPKWLLDAKGEFYNAVRWPEFAVQIADYLKTTGSEVSEDARGDDRARQAVHRRARRRRAARTRPLDAVQARGRERHARRLPLQVVHDHGLPMVRAIVEGMLAAQQLDAIVYPTSSRRPGLIAGAGRTRRRRTARRRPISRTSPAFPI